MNLLLVEQILKLAKCHCCVLLECLFHAERHSPSSSSCMETSPAQAVRGVDLEACTQDRVITEGADYAIPPT